jgi:uncharacterized SAM-binding protein YcdF (DUF218 family)
VKLRPLLAWVIGFCWFAIALPQPAPASKSDAIAVVTGGSGRIDRALALLRGGAAPRVLVSGVDREVKPHEFALKFGASPGLMACCVTLGFDSVDTRTNAAEIARWMRQNGVHSVRLVTSDWHMRRAALELRAVTPAGTTMIEDAVPTQPSLRVLFLEYNKLLARWFSRMWGA